MTAAIATVALVLAGGPATADATPAACAHDLRPAEYALAQRVVDLVNGHRRAHGLRPVRLGPALARAAAWKAAHMARNRYMAHADLPGARTLAQRLRACGFGGSGWGEVLAAGYRRPRAVVRAWLASPGHRAVIEARLWRVAGAGVARARDGDRYWVLDFGA